MALLMQFRELEAHEKLIFAQMWISPIFQRMIMKEKEDAITRISTIDPNLPPAELSLAFQVARREHDFWTEMVQLTGAVAKEIQGVQVSAS